MKVLKSSRLHRAKQALLDDWRGTRVRSYGAILLLISGLVTIAYYCNLPKVATNDDTGSYLQATQAILAHGQFVDVERVPGFPSFLALIFLLTGSNNLFAVSVVDGFFFVLVALEVYLITWMIFHRAWLAFITGLLVGTNIYLLAFTKPVTVEGFSLWLVTTLAVFAVVFIQTLRVRDFWLVTALLLVTLMTRPEWMYVPLPLFAYLLFLAARRGRLRRLLPHAVAAVLILYGVLGLYIYENAVQNGFSGVSEVQNVNELGKVMQYRMQNEAPPQYAQLTREINTLLAAKPDATPYDLAVVDPAIVDHHWALSKAYAEAVITHHPVEFLVKTLPVFFTSFSERYVFSQIDHQGAFALPLLTLQVFSADIQWTYRFFPLFALAGVVVLCWRRTGRWRSVEMIGAVVLLGAYDLVVTSVGGYDDYMRFHVPFAPLVTIAVWGSLLLGLAWCEPYVLRGFVQKALLRLWRVIGWVWAVLAVIVVPVLVGWALVAGGVNDLVHPQNWPVFILFHARPFLLSCLIAIPVLPTFFAYRASLATRTSGMVSPGRGVADEGTVMPRASIEPLEADEAVSIEKTASSG